uniref:Uncharacterized protein n=1 Tax=Latimeria chalumnae TaxID=7897 RepID=H3A9A0_LATCH
EDKISLCLVLRDQGKEQRTLLEVPYSDLDQLAELLVAHLEKIVDSITTVDGRREDDIAVGHPNAVDGQQDCTELTVESFRTLFESEWCKMPYHAGFQYLDSMPHHHGELVAFRATETLGNSDPTKKNKASMEEHLAVMYEKLRNELPNFFLKTHDYGIYSHDMEFIIGFLHLKTRGRPAYQMALTLCRFLAWNYFADMQMEVLKLTQHPENGTIQARWRVTGLPLHVLMTRFYRKEKAELYRTYDAFSTFYLGSDGLIHCHRVDKMMPSQPLSNKVKRLLVSALVALGLEEHRPALHLLLAQLAMKMNQKYC